MHGLVPVSYTVVPRHTATTVQGGASDVTLSECSEQCTGRAWSLVRGSFSAV